MHHDHDHGSPKVGPNVDPQEFASHPHAFVLVGKESLFGCHMTSLWMLGHTYEIVLRLHLPYDVVEAYKRVIAEPPSTRHRERLHASDTCFLTCFPDPFPLPELLLGRRSFRAQLSRGFPRQFMGWPWSAETPVKDDFPVEVERVVAFRHFDFQVPRPETQTYVLFGERNEAHLYHHQTKEPDYDHVASLEAAPAWLHPERLRAGVHVNFPDLRGDETLCDDPFAAQKAWQVQYQGTGPSRAVAVSHSQWFSTLVTNRPEAPPCGPPASASRARSSAAATAFTAGHSSAQARKEHG